MRCAPDRDGQTYRPFFSVLNGFLDEAFKWEFLLLRPGDDLFLRPNTPHCIVALEASFLVGGFFYSARCLDRTMSALTMQHYFGHLCVCDDRLATSVSRAGVLLMKMLQHSTKIVKRELSYCINDMDLPENLIQPLCPEDLAILIVILGNLHQLDPSLGLDDDEFGQDDGDGRYPTRRLPFPRPQSRDAIYTSPGPVFRQGDNVIIEMNGMPSVWQFTANFKHDHLETIATELPALFNVLLARNTTQIHSKLTAAQRQFDKLKKHFQEAATIRERDRSISGHGAFIQQITVYTKTSKIQEKDKAARHTAQTEGEQGADIADGRSSKRQKTN